MVERVGLLTNRAPNKVKGPLRVMPFVVEVLSGVEVLLE